MNKRPDGDDSAPSRRPDDREPVADLSATVPEVELSATWSEADLSATVPENALSQTLVEGDLSLTTPEAADGLDVTVRENPNAFSLEDARSLWATVVEADDADVGMTLKADEGLAGNAARTDSTMLRRTRVVDLTSTEPGTLPPESVAGDFCTQRVLGKGGMGTVFLATQRSLDREVALKVISGDKSTKQDVKQKFIAEARVTGELDHPNIIPVYELAEAEDGTPFYSMKVIRGKPWSKELPGKSEMENIDILLRLADAVGFAHDKGVVHRDLKPENVMLGDYGEVVLMDWGLAVSVDPSGKAEQVTTKNAFAGTPAYMAPEMARGNIDAIGPRTDIYLLGAILYEIITGRRPHTGGSVYICIMAAAENFFTPTDRDDELMAIAKKALAAEPDDRYQTVKDFQAAIREYLSHRESNLLADGAEKQLENGIGREDYESLAQAIFGLNEAVRLWDGNEEAKRLLRRARIAYARCAHSRGDFDLALSQLKDMDGDDAEELRRTVNTARAEEEARRRRLRTVTRTAIGLTAALVAVLVTATIIVYDRMAKEAEARAIAQEQERVAVQALKDTEEARLKERETNERYLAVAREREETLLRQQEAQRAALEAAREREAALAREKEAQEKALAAAQEREKAIAREKEAQEGRLAALEREQEERRQRTLAEQQRAEEEELRIQREEELARRGYLEDDSWWAFDPDRARELKAQAAERIGAAEALSVALADADAMTLQLIPNGIFVMGSNPRDSLRKSDEYLHRVTITRPFYLSQTELTRGQWRAVIGVESAQDLLPTLASQPSERDGEASPGLKAVEWRTRQLEDGEEDLPATGISYREAVELLLPRLAELAPDGWRFDLPSEAEWEFACRAGSSDRYWTGEEESDLARAGWYFGNSNLLPSPVAQLAPNPWGLYDTHGNACEFTRDAYAAAFYLESPLEDPVNSGESTLRIIRGGSYIHPAPGCRSASRGNVHIDNRYAEVGLRLALYLAAQDGDSGE